MNSVAGTFKTVFYYLMPSTERLPFPSLLNIEKFVLALCLLMHGAMMLLLYVKQVPYDAHVYLKINLTVIAFLFAGQLFRCFWVCERISLPCTFTALSLQYAAYASAMSYLLVPVGQERIDPILQKIDKGFGFDWVHFSTFFAERPLFLEILEKVYMSTFLQAMVMVILLGIYLQRKTLMMFLLVSVLGSLFTLLFWHFFPSAGAASSLLQSPEISSALENAPLVADKSYGIWVNEVFKQGIDKMMFHFGAGIISFPSYHTVLALTVIFSMKPIRPVFYFYIGVNLLMLPATIVHGAHYLVDIWGGIITFFMAWICAQYLMGFLEDDLKDDPHSF